MSDLFHERIGFDHIAAIFGVMASAPQHQFQVLTKRPARALEFFHWIENDADGAASGCILHAREILGVHYGLRYEPDDAPPWPLPNVWLGVSVEDQATADERIPLLLQTPAAVRWISAEPLLGPVDLFRLEVFPGFCMSAVFGGDRLRWVVAGGESGPGARPSHPDWFRGLRDQCAAAGVPFFFKQHGEWLATEFCDDDMAIIQRNRKLYLRRVGKKKAGHLLDGRTHDEYPA